MYGTARFGWQIDGIKCDFIFLDEDGKNREPKNRDFEPGEFEKLYKASPTIEIVFDKGMNFLDPALLAYIAEESKETHPELGLALQTINLKGVKPSAVFEIAAQHLSDKAEKHVVSKKDEIYGNPRLIEQMMTAFVNLTESNKLLAETTSKGQTIINAEGNVYKDSKHHENISGNKTNSGNIEIHNVSSLSQDQINELKNAITQLEDTVIRKLQMVASLSILNKKQKGERIKEILLSHGISIVNGINSSVIFEFVKGFFL